MFCPFERIAAFIAAGAHFAVARVEQGVRDVYSSYHR